MKKFFIGFLILTLIGGIVAYFQFNRKIEGLENTPPAYQLSADELFDAFNENEAEATSTYTDQVIEVSGIVDRIKVDSASVNVIVYAENAMAGGINCSFPKLDQTLNKGDQITVKGRCQGFLMDVVLNNCVLVE